MNKRVILIAEDDEIMRSALTNALSREGYEVRTAIDGSEAWEQYHTNDIDLVLADIKMPKMDGIELLKEIKKTSYETIVILMTAHGTIPDAVEAIKLGAYDYITKPFLIEELLMIIQRAFELYLLTDKTSEVDKFHNIVGRNKEMQKVYQLIETIAPGDSSVVIYGETGSGKELIAEAIHYMSKRKDKPFIKISCGGFPETLLESELFGHEKGAFTGASERKTGRFELAKDGTLLLDDIDDLSLSAQVKLLRFMQEKKFERVGGIETIEMDVRIVAASKKDLRQEVTKGRFREDLFYRLNVIPIFLPPLRERRDDIPLLARHFLGHYSETLNKKVERFSSQALNALFEYDWSGNVRELENIVERAVALCKGSEITPEEVLPSLGSRRSLRSGKIIISADLKPAGDVVKETEKQHIKKILKETGGQKIKAAEILGISRKTLWEKIREYKIK
ncbi:MAG: sigma-54-dependent Fis family transcriptional regulator [Planctomycetes bacterium]|nr:sigma-54-dependent Fis family transcriptional regulator [Planctomycetota bacterium]